MHPELKAAYLELIQMSTLLLLQKKPKIGTQVQATALVASAVTAQASVQPVNPPKQPVAIEPKVLKPALKTHAAVKEDISPFLELLKSKLPAIKWFDHPYSGLSDIVIMYASEAEEELELFKRISEALQREGFPCLLLHADELGSCKPTQSVFKVLIASQELLKTRPEFSKMALQISSADLQHFIREPSSRTQWWKNLLTYLRQPLQ